MTNDFNEFLRNIHEHASLSGRGIALPDDVGWMMGRPEELRAVDEVFVPGLGDWFRTVFQREYGIVLSEEPDVTSEPDHLHWSVKERLVEDVWHRYVSFGPFIVLETFDAADGERTVDFTFFNHVSALLGALWCLNVSEAVGLLPFPPRCYVVNGLYERGHPLGSGLSCMSDSFLFVDDDDGDGVCGVFWKNDREREPQRTRVGRTVMTTTAVRTTPRLEGVSIPMTIRAPSPDARLDPWLARMIFTVPPGMRRGRPMPLPDLWTLL